MYIVYDRHRYWPLHLITDFSKTKWKWELPTPEEA